MFMILVSIFDRTIFENSHLTYVWQFPKYISEFTLHFIMSET